MNMVVSAALTGAAMPEPLIQPDPIFAAIEVHRKARADFEDSFKRKEDDDTRDRLCHLETQAACELASIAPTSMRGVLALLVYAAEVDTDGMGWPDGLVTDQKQKLGRSWYHYMVKSVAEGLQAQVDMVRT